MIRITVLNDNRKMNDDFESEHGLSLLIEADGKTILMDAGQTDIYKSNARILGIDLDTVDSIVLSHGDYDHGNGLKHFDKKVDLICHPHCNCYRISKRTGDFSGLNQTKDELESRFNVKQNTNPYNITENVIFLGEIERKYDFEEKNLPAVDKDGEEYKHLDDSGIVIKTEKGIIVISGCAHSGICNTIEYAKKITGDNRVIAVMGGFHLKEVNESTLKTVEYMKKNNIRNILLAHCTSDVVCEEFTKQLPKMVNIIKTGLTYEF